MTDESNPSQAELDEEWLGKWVDIDSTHPYAGPEDGPDWQGPFTTLCVTAVSAPYRVPECGTILWLEVTGWTLWGTIETVTHWGGCWWPPEVADPYAVFEGAGVKEPNLFSGVPA